MMHSLVCKVCVILILSSFGLEQYVVTGASVKKPQPLRKAADYKINIAMPAYKPKKNDDYVCTTLKIEKPGYILAYHPTAHADRVHHMLLYGCPEKPKYPEGTVWDCDSSPCSVILYAWARNAPALQLPNDVGFEIGQNGAPMYFALQVHYATPFVGNVLDYTGITMDIGIARPQYLSGIYLFDSGGAIPADTETIFINMSCPYNGNVDLHPFAFRTHTHSLGRVVSAAFNRNGQWSVLGKRNPQWPQMFQLMDKSLTIEKGDQLAAQCRFNSTGRHRDTHMGATGHDEMCNFYMMYYRDANAPSPFPYRFQNRCGDTISAMNWFQDYPEEASALLPLQPELEEQARRSKTKFGVTELAKWTKAGSIEFGQISGLAFDPDGNLVVFHRGSTVWGPKTFDNSNRLVDRTAVSTDALVTLNPETGSVLSSWGKNQFYIPHGVFVAKSGNFWLTDVGMHQVLKYSPESGGMKLSQAWGEAFVPGNDQNHFCKPAAVTVASDGGFFVADGYCNSRIVRFSSSGNFLQQFGSQSSSTGEPQLGTFLLPHDITLDEQVNHIHVADRENGRVQILLTNGTALSQIRPPMDMFKTVYSTDYNANAHTVFMLPGEESVNEKDRSIKVFAASHQTGRVLYSWKPTSEDFQRPHIMRVSPDGQFVFVGEIATGNGRLWKFRIERDAKHTAPGVKQGVELAQDVSPTSNSNPAAVKSGNSIIDVTPMSVGKFVGIVAIVVVILLLAVALFCACRRFRKQGGFRATNIMGSSFLENKSLLKAPFRDQRGVFQPLSTEDIDAVDDLTTDESDAEDTLYPVRTPPKRGPLSA